MARCKIFNVEADISESIVAAPGDFLVLEKKALRFPFDAVKKTKKNNEAYLTPDVTKDNLKSAPNMIETRQDGFRTPPVAPLRVS